MIKSEESDLDELPSSPPEVLADAVSDVLEEPSSATLTSLPRKSRQKYEREYSRFMEWRKEKNVKTPTENDLLSYFTEKAKVFKSTSLWSQFSMLKATLIIKDGVDIGKFTRLIAFLKRKSVGHKTKSTKTFTRAQINKFLLEAPDEYYLLMKVALIMGIAGACRRDELCKMTIDDIQDAGSVLIVKIPENESRASRTFIVTGETDSELNPIQIYRKYAALRPSHAEHRRFFLYYRAGRCTVQVVGIHTFSKIPCHVAKYLQLPDPASYTGQCFRKTSASLLASSGADILTLERHGGWKTSKVTKDRVEIHVEKSPQITTDFDSTSTMPLITTTMGAGYSELYIEEPQITSDFDSSMTLIAEEDIKVERKNPDLPHKEEQENQAEWEKTDASPSNTPRCSESTFEEAVLGVNGLSEVSGQSLEPTEMESLKNDLLTEMRKEMSKMKHDIIEAIKLELSRR